MTGARAALVVARERTRPFQSMLRLVFPGQARRRRPGAWSRSVPPLLAWAVLAGLFFMHGAPFSAGCQGGAAMAPTAAPAAAALPVAMSGAAAGPARVTAGRPASMPPASRVMAEERGTGCAGLCSSRQPRQGSAGALAVGPAGAVIRSEAAPAARLAASARGPRPPGRPGLPLPLFLGVSRT